MTKKKKIEDWLGIDRRHIKKALHDLEKWYEEQIKTPKARRALKRIFDEYEIKVEGMDEWPTKYPQIEFHKDPLIKSFLIFLFLRPQKTLPSDPEELDEWAREGKWILSSSAKGYVENSPTIEDLINTGWGNCMALSCLYKILATERDIDCKISILTKHALNLIFVPEKIVIDVTNHVFGGKPDEAYKKMDSLFHYETVRESSEEFAYYIILGERSRVVRKHKDTIKFYDKALKIDSDHAGAWGNTGLALKSLGKQEKAIKCLDKALKIDPDDAHVWNNKGTSLYSLGKHKEAMECYDKALKIDPEDVQVWNNMGAALYSLGKHKEAINCYDKALKIDPDYALVWSNKGDALDALGKQEEAEKCFKKARKLGNNIDKI